MANKQPLIVLHGALGATVQFDQLVELLSENFDVHTFNFSGHGGRSFNSDFSIEEFAKNLDEFIQSKGLQHVDVFGYSMGGYVALKLASYKPDLIGKIHTLGTKFNWTPETAAKEVKMLNPEKIEEKVPAFAKALAERHAPNDWKEVLNKTKEMMLALGDKNALTPQDFSSIGHQVIIGIGDEDNMATIEESEQVANNLPNGTLKKFEGFKHPIEQVDQKELANTLTKFFKK